MDYVLFGMGYGATLMLLGWALRTFGPERKYKDVNPEDIDRTVELRRWVRFLQGLGGVFAIAGTAMVLFTFVIMLVNPDDETGAFIALVLWGFFAITVLLWCWFYVSSYGLLGIWSRQSGYGFRASSSYPARSTSAGASTSRVVRPPSLDQPDTSHDSAAAAPEPEAIEDVESGVSEGDQPLPEEVSSDSIEATPFHAELEKVADSESEADSEYDFGDSTETTVTSETGGRAEAIRRLQERKARTENSTD